MVLFIMLSSLVSIKLVDLYVSGFSNIRMTKIIKYHKSIKHHKLKPNTRLCKWKGIDWGQESQDHLMYSLESALQMSELIQPWDLSGQTLLFSFTKYRRRLKLLLYAGPGPQLHWW